MLPSNKLKESCNWMSCWPTIFPPCPSGAVPQLRPQCTPSTCTSRASGSPVHSNSKRSLFKTEMRSYRVIVTRCCLGQEVKGVVKSLWTHIPPRAQGIKERTQINQTLSQFKLLCFQGHYEEGFGDSQRGSVFASRISSKRLASGI